MLGIGSVKGSFICSVVVLVQLLCWFSSLVGSVFFGSVVLLVQLFGSVVWLVQLFYWFSSLVQLFGSVVVVLVQLFDWFSFVGSFIVSVIGRMVVH